MPALADMLDPGDREQLAVLADPPPDLGDLAAAARDAAAESTGPGRVAWSLVALALCSGGSAETARGIIDAIVHDSQVRTVALACLAALCGDGTNPSRRKIEWNSRSPTRSARAA